MIKTTLTTLMFATLAFAVSPASAASVSCSGPNLTKAEASVDQMADGPVRWNAFHEISAAQDDLLAGKMGGCARHIGKVMQMGTMRPAGM